MNAGPWRCTCAVVALIMLAFWTAQAAQGQVFVGPGRVIINAGAGGGAAVASVNDKISGLHIPQGQRVNFTPLAMTDGAGFPWDIQHYGTVASGMNSVYSGAMYCQIGGTNVPSMGWGWMNKAGDEVELGPHPWNNLRISRRIKVYKDQGLARWMDIFENPGPSDVTAQVAVYSNFNWGIARVITNTEAANFGEKDWAFVTEMQGGGNNLPSLLHIVCDKNGKVRPAVQAQGNQVFLRYNLTVPAKSAAILCHFESQGRSTADQLKAMKAFRPYKALKDLPAQVRKLIVNFAGIGGFGGVELERTTSGDAAYQVTGEPVFGTIQNEEFTVEALYGRMKLKAGDVLGMVVEPGETGNVRVAMKDGQIVCGRALDEKIRMTLSTGGPPLAIPITAIAQWSFRISEQRPEECAPILPAVVLRSGDRLAFDPSALKLAFRTRHGTVELEGKGLYEIVLDNAGNGVHRAVFLNGSSLAGFLEPDNISVPLKLGPQLKIPRDMISRLQFGAEPQEIDSLARAVLTNDDQLNGALVDPTIRIQTYDSLQELKPANIKAMSFSSTHLGRATVTLWDDSVIRGQLEQPELSFQITSGPTLKIFAGQLVSITFASAKPPEDKQKEVERLVGRLGAESFKDRQAATDELIKKGPGIAPLLKKYLSDPDPEVRQRIEDILERIGGQEKTPADAIEPIMRFR